MQCDSLENNHFSLPKVIDNNERLFTGVCKTLKKRPYLPLLGGAVLRKNAVVITAFCNFYANYMWGFKLLAEKGRGSLAFCEFL